MQPGWAMATDERDQDTGQVQKRGRSIRRCVAGVAAVRVVSWVVRVKVLRTGATQHRGGVEVGEARSGRGGAVLHLMLSHSPSVDRARHGGVLLARDKNFLRNGSSSLRFELLRNVSAIR